MRFAANAALCAAFAFAVSGCTIAPPEKTFAVAGKPAPEIALTDQNGAPFRLSDRRGETTVVFFGYAHCEDVCPATLAHLHRAIALQPAERRPHIGVAFVTVDPHRDDATTLKKYVEQFDPAFLGLTGTFAELRPIYTAYHVFRNIVPRNFGKPYLVAHEGAIYIVDGDGILRALRDWRDSPERIAKDLAHSPP